MVPTKSPTPTLVNQVNFEDDSIMSSNFVDIERPPRRKVEKYKKKRKGKDMENDSTGLCVNLLQEMREEKRQFNEKKLQLFEKTYVQGQERLAFKQEKLRLEQMEDERIITIDTARMP